MWTLFEQLSQWHWFIFGLLLLIGEALGASGFLLGTSVAALLMGVIVSIAASLSETGLGWQVQIILGAFFSVIFSLLYWRFFRAEQQASDRPELNHRTAQLVGRKLVLDKDIPFEGRIQIGDTFWKVVTDTPLNNGEHVEVISADATTLTLRKLDV
jgi:membrane protein implicated in regulation of membrane protease activity